MRIIFAILTMTVFAFAGCFGNDSGDDNGDDDGTGSPSGSSTDTGTPTPAGPMTHTVKLEGNKFVNASITINVGDTVKWDHQDGTTPHNIESAAPAFDSHPNCVAPIPSDPPCMVQTSPDYSRVFTAAGTVNYRCEIHTAMTGTITVVDPAAGNTTASAGS